MEKLRSFLGYTAAAITVAAAMLTPFLLISVFTKAVAETGIRINDAYSGGEPEIDIDRGSYHIVVNHPVTPSAPLQRSSPFVQVSWSPAKTLPVHVSDEIDLDRDGIPDVDIEFQVPPDPKEPLEAEVRALTAVTSSCRIGRDSFSSLICRAGDRIVVRLPWNRKPQGSLK